MNNNTKQMLRIKDAASLLGISTITLYNWVHKCKVPFHRHPGGKFLMFDKNELAEWYNANSH